VPVDRHRARPAHSRPSALFLDEAQTEHDNDIVARGGLAATCERLEAGHVVSDLEAQMHSVDGELASDTAIGGEIVRRIEGELGDVVASSAATDADKRCDLPGAAQGHLGAPRFSSDITDEDVELGLASDGEVVAPRPFKGARDGERRAWDIGHNHCRQVCPLDAGPLGTGGHEPAAGDVEFPGCRWRGWGLGFGGARRGEEHGECPNGPEQDARESLATSTGGA